MRSAHVATVMLAASLAAHADFSYTMTQKSGGQMGSGAGQVMKHYMKGQKMKIETGTTATVLDFDAQTITTIDNSAKSYKVAKFSDAAGATAGADVKADVKSTGQTKTINGFQAAQTLITMDMDMPQGQAAGMKAQMEIELWVSRNVPGGQELVSFYKKNAARFPASALGGGNPGIQTAMAKLQQQMAQADGVPVEEVVRVKSSGGPSMPTMSAAQTQQMAQARAQMEAMAKGGGPQAAAMQAAMARMGNMGSAGASGAPLMEITMDASDFSSAPIPDSAFAIPAGYEKK
jgi:hypothetical protein